MAAFSPTFFLCMAIILYAAVSSASDKPSPPVVYALYGSGEVTSAEYACDTEISRADLKADLRTLYFPVLDSTGGTLAFRTCHFLDIRYFLLDRRAWDEGAEYVREKMLWEEVVFLPIRVSDGTDASYVLRSPQHRGYYLQRFDSISTAPYSKRKPAGRDYLFDPDDDWRRGGLLAVATSEANLNEARKTEYVREVLRRYREIRTR